MVIPTTYPLYPHSFCFTSENCSESSLLKKAPLEPIKGHFKLIPNNLTSAAGKSGTKWKSWWEKVEERDRPDRHLENPVE